MLGINNVGIHNLSPGMVTTDLLMAGAPIPYPSQPCPLAYLSI